MSISTPTSVLAEVLNENSYEGGIADEALDPGQGCVRYYNNTDEEYNVRAATADEDTARVVREQRNPPRSLGSTGDSPLDDGYNADDTVETVGFNPYDQVRVRKGDNASADISDDARIAWDEDGNATDEDGDVDGEATSPTVFWGRFVEEIDRGDDDTFLLVEVL